MTVAVLDESDIFKYSPEQKWSCQASSFPQYLNNLLSDASYPANCETPAINVFEDVEVVYVEEVPSLGGTRFGIGLTSQISWATGE